MQNKGLIIGVTGGIIAAAVVIALFATGTVTLPGQFSLETIEGERTEQGIVAVPGTGAITEEGTVLAPSGAPTQNDADPSDPNAPQQSGAIDPETLPSQSIKLVVSSAGFIPNTFTVKAGSPVTLAVTSGDTQTHVFAFNDPELSGVAIGIGPEETRATSFNAPSEKGTYSFYCNVPGHAARGEVGTMIVE